MKTKVVFKRKERKETPTRKGAVPISLTALLPEADGTLFRYMLPVDGEVSGITLRIDEMSRKTCKLRLDAYTQDQQVIVTEFGKRGLVELDTVFEAKKGDRFILKVDEPIGEGEEPLTLSGIWLTFLITPKS